MNFITDYFDKTLIPEWRSAWQKWSIKFQAYVAAGIGIWALVPEESRSEVLAAIGVPPRWIVLAIVVIGIALRLKKQQAKEEPDKQDPA